MKHFSSIERNICLSGALFFFGSAVAHAANWQLEPRLSVTELFTDNVELDSQDRESKFISEVSPGITLLGEGRRLQVSLDYLMRTTSYSPETDAANIFHQLTSSAETELIRNMFFIDAHGSLARRRIDPSSGNLPSFAFAGEGFSDVTIVGASPYFKWGVGRDTSAELRYSYDRVKYDVVDSADGEFDQWAFTIGDESGSDNYRWVLDYSNSRSKYDDGGEAYLDNVNATFYIPVAYRMNLKLEAGYEHNEYIFTTVPRIDKGDSWGVGLRWAPSREFVMDVASGKRYYGEYSSLDVLFDTTSFGVGLTYHEEVESQLASQVGRAVDGSARTESASEFATPVVDSDIYLLKSLNADIRYSRESDDITLNLYSDRRESQIDFEEERVNGAQLSFSRGLSLGLRGVLEVGRSKRHYIREERIDMLFEYGAMLSKQIDSGFAADLRYDHSRRNSNNPSSSYRENRLTLTVSLTF